MRKTREEILAAIELDPFFSPLSIGEMGDAIHSIDIEISAMEINSERKKFQELLRQRVMISSAIKEKKWLLKIMPTAVHALLPGKRKPDGKGGFFRTLFA